MTLYMDLWNNEILSYSLSGRKGDRMTYISGLKDLISIKQKYPGLGNDSSYRSGIGLCHLRTLMSFCLYNNIVSFYVQSRNPNR